MRMPPSTACSGPRSLAESRDQARFSGRVATSFHAASAPRARPRRRSNPSPVSAVGTAGMPSTRCGACADSWTSCSAGRGNAGDGVTRSCSWRATISNGGASSRSTRRAACDFVPRWSCPDAAGSSMSSRPTATARSVRQTAIFDPKGLSGRLYWYAAAPLHHLVFNGTLRGIAEQCLDAANGGGRSSTVAARSPRVGGRRKGRTYERHLAHRQRRRHVRVPFHSRTQPGGQEDPTS